MPKQPQKLATIAAALIAAVVLSGQADAQQAPSIKLDIPAQPLADALRALGFASNTNIVFDPGLVAGMKSPALTGMSTAEQAVTRLLSGTQLRFKFVDEKTISIMPPAAASGPSGKTTEKGGPQVTVGSLSLTMAEVDAIRSDDADTAGETTAAARTKKNDGVEEMIVEETKIKPFSDANVDIPRTINDVQPYYIFDSETIERSAAINIEDFLKQRLTMNTAARTYAQATTSPDIYGNISAINLRGLGADKTLVLINGRRIAGPKGDSLANPPSQTDLNGIPLSAIDRIEVLPSSASGIYGGSALGGVINVILKKSYSGGEVRLTYDNVWDSDSPSRTAGFSYGTGFNGGQTQVMLSAQWSDAESLRLQDREELYRSGLSRVLRNSQSFVYSGTFLGATPNILADYVFPTGAPAYQPQLSLKNGVSLGSTMTYIPAGTSPNTPQADLYAALLANAGKWNFELPRSVQSPTGLLRQLTLEPTAKSFMASVRHAWTPNLDINLDVSRSENSSVTPYSSLFPNSYSVTADHPNNPFAVGVTVVVPHAEKIPQISESVTESLTLGFSAKLPGSWVAQADYTWSRNRLDFNAPYFDTTALASAVYGPASVNGVFYPSIGGMFPAAGIMNPFVDTLQYPLNYQRFTDNNEFSYGLDSRSDDFAIRGAGPLWALPWGKPSLTVGIEHRISSTPEIYRNSIRSIVTTANAQTRYFARTQSADSAYMEVSVPLVKQAAFPLLYSAEMQLSGRAERLEIDTGTPTVTTNLFTGAVSYGSPNLNGQPIFSRDSYSSQNQTIGLKYQPVQELIIRTSIATAFLPPTPAQLIKNPILNNGFSTVLDPLRNNVQAQVQTISGGNPELVPQNSKSWNAGLIWQPSSQALSGLRFNAEYYRIQQFDAIGSLSAQVLLNNESNFPGRVVRNAAGAVTFIDTSLLNLYRRSTEGWDLSADYQVKTVVGNFGLRAAESIVLGLQEQYSLVLPEFDRVNFPSEGGAAKYKSNLMLTWDYKNWNAGWVARYFGSYKQLGTLGGPNATQTRASNPNAPLLTTYTNAQGGDTIPSQMYHDFSLGYTFARRSANMRSAFTSEILSGLTVQLGIKNVFDKTPPFDVYYDYYISPYGDTRLRSYWLSAKKAF